jgi:hypothetical protein
MKPLRVRFDEMWTPEPNSGCWLWLANMDNSGYGRIQVKGKSKRAHRVSYELNIGPIPDGLHCLHSCDVPLCVNPSHLWLGTNLDNIADKAKKGRCANQEGEINPNSKLTKIEVLAIRSDDRIDNLIALDYGIGRRHVSKIKSLQYWRHI